jgi:hypothetical protein
LSERPLFLPVVVSLLVLGILVHGFLQRGSEVAPEESAGSDPAARAPTPTPFRPDLEKVPLTYFSDYWLQLGERAHDLLVTFGQAALTGVRVSQGYALSSVEAADMVRAAPGDVPEGQLVAVDARRGLALFRLTADVGTTPRPAAGFLHAGAWIAAVTMDSQRGLQVAPGYLASASSGASPWLDVAVAFPPTFDVAAVVDLDSRLVGVAFRGPDGVKVLSAEAAGALVDELASSPSCRAVDVAPIPDALSAALRVKDGVVVEAVAVEAFAAPPDLLPGDVLLQMAGEQLSSPEDFAEIWDRQEPGSQVRLLVSRGSRRLVRRTEMPGRDCRPAWMMPREMPRLGAVVQWARAAGTRGFRVLHVPEESPAAKAGIEIGDIVITVDGRPLAWPEARQLLAPDWSSDRVPVLALRRGDALVLAAPPVGEGE